MYRPLVDVSRGGAGLPGGGGQSASRGGGLPRRGASWGGLHPKGFCPTPPGLPMRGGVDPLPPVNRMIHMCGNITLPQTSFAGGKNSNFDPYNFTQLILLSQQLTCFWLIHAVNTNTGGKE